MEYGPSSGVQPGGDIFPARIIGPGTPITDASGTWTPYGFAACRPDVNVLGYPDDEFVGRNGDATVSPPKNAAVAPRINSSTQTEPTFNPGDLVFLRLRSWHKEIQGLLYDVVLSGGTGGATGLVSGGCTCCKQQPRQWQVSNAFWSDGCCGSPAIPSQFLLNLVTSTTCQWSTNLTHAPADICVAPPFTQYTNVLLQISGNPPGTCQITVTLTGVGTIAVGGPTVILFVIVFQSAVPAGEFLNGVQLNFASYASVDGLMCSLHPAFLLVTPQ